MWDFFLEGITKVGIFILCAQTLVHLRPKASYEKYMKLLVSVMLLVQLLAPVWALLSSGEGVEQRIFKYEDLLEEGMGQLWQENEDSEQILARLIREQMLIQEADASLDEIYTQEENITEELTVSGDRTYVDESAGTNAGMNTDVPVEIGIGTGRIVIEKIIID